jgi:hypothetical protein
MDSTGNAKCNNSSVAMSVLVAVGTRLPSRFLAMIQGYINTDRQLGDLKSLLLFFLMEIVKLKL